MFVGSPNTDAATTEKTAGSLPKFSTECSSPSLLSVNDCFDESGQIRIQ